VAEDLAGAVSEWPCKAGGLEGAFAVVLKEGEGGREGRLVRRAK